MTRNTAATRIDLGRFSDLRRAAIARHERRHRMRIAGLVAVFLAGIVTSQIATGWMTAHNAARLESEQ